MTAVSDVHIAGLKKRIQFISTIFPLREGVRASLNGADVSPEECVNEFVDTLWAWSGRSLPESGDREEAWERIIKSDMLPGDLFKGLSSMYLGLPEEALMAESFKEFADLIRPRWRAYNAFSCTCCSSSRPFGSLSACSPGSTSRSEPRHAPRPRT